MRNFFIACFFIIPILGFCQNHSTPEVQEFTLDNGLKIRVKEDHRAPVAVSMLWYHVGSADEPGGITGVSHALEHMMFKGTSRYPQGVFSKIIAGLGGQENAFTSTDYTAYFEKITSTELAKVFALEADRMRHLLLLPQDFAKEIKVIEEERRSRTDDNPQALTFERFLATAHLTPAYSHPVIGWMSDLKTLNVQDLRRWYQRYYAPNNATLVVVGDVKGKEIYQLAKKYFSNLAKSPIRQPKPELEPTCLGQKMVEVHTRAEVPLLMLGFNVPSLKTAEQAKDAYALELLASVLDAGDSARLSRHLIRGTQQASSLAVSYDLYARYPTQFMMYGTPSQGVRMDTLKKALLAEVTALQKEPISKEELDRVKTQLIAEKTFEKDSIFGQAMEIGVLETVGLGWKIGEHYVEALQKITPKDLQETAVRYFNIYCMTEAHLIPETKETKSRIH